VKLGVAMRKWLLTFLFLILLILYARAEWVAHQWMEEAHRLKVELKKINSQHKTELRNISLSSGYWEWLAAECIEKSLHKNLVLENLDSFNVAYNFVSSQFDPYYAPRHEYIITKDDKFFKVDVILEEDYILNNHWVGDGYGSSGCDIVAYDNIRITQNLFPYFPEKVWGIAWRDISMPIDKELLDLHYCDSGDMYENLFCSKSDQYVYGEILP
jgi:hypothetical protein